MMWNSFVLIKILTLCFISLLECLGGLVLQFRYLALMALGAGEGTSQRDLSPDGRSTVCVAWCSHPSWFLSYSVLWSCHPLQELLCDLAPLPLLGCLSHVCTSLPVCALLHWSAPVHPYPGKNRSSRISSVKRKERPQFYWILSLPGFTVSQGFRHQSHGLKNQSLAGLSWCAFIILTWRWGRNGDLDNWETGVVWIHMVLWLLEFAKHL